MDLEIAFEVPLERVVSGGDEVRGHFIEYDAISEQYQVTNAPAGAAGSPDGRVRAVIQPKNETP